MKPAYCARCERTVDVWRMVEGFCPQCWKKIRRAENKGTGTKYRTEEHEFQELLKTLAKRTDD